MLITANGDDVDDLEAALPVENYFKVETGDRVLAQNAFYNLVTVAVTTGEIVEISSEACFELQATFTGMDPLLYIIFKDDATSTNDNVSFKRFTDSAAPSEAIRCGSVSWKGAIAEDGTIAVWVRGNSVEDGNVTMKNKFSNAGYKIWEAGYTSPSDSAA